MPRARLIKFLACFGIFVCPPTWLHAQPVLGQMIEQAKKNKLVEMMPAPASDALAAGRKNDGAYAAQNTTPVLWSLSGLNRSLAAELLIGEKIYPVRIFSGASLPGGWTIVDGNADSLTLKRGRKAVTLYPLAPGTSGGQFASLRRAHSSDPDSLLGVQESLNNRGLPIDFISIDAAKPPSRPAANIDAARQAAGALPNRP